ncbi:MAG: hypothetical protein EOO04_09815 [Chitinophagaceae bacterium]|nr:MAG: hypothetical protein EOO04_09815 [Chitinophagaceae bacterium]
MSNIKTANFGDPESYSNLNDRWLFIFVYPVVPFIVIHVGNDNSVSALLLNPTYYSDLALGLFCTYIIGYYLRAVYSGKGIWTTILKSYMFSGLGKSSRILSKNPWLTRFARNIIFPIIVPLTIVMAMEAIYLELFLNIPLGESAILYLELPVVTLVLTIINLVYGQINTRQRYHSLSFSIKTPNSQAAHLNKLHPEIYKQCFIVNRGATTLQIPISKVAYFIINSKITFLITDENEKYIYGETIEKLSGILQPETFFQLNRQIFTSRAAVNGYEQTTTRKLEIQLHPKPVEPVFVSKQRAGKFTRWFTNDFQSIT